MTQPGNQGVEEAEELNRSSLKCIESLMGGPNLDRDTSIGAR